MRFIIIDGTDFSKPIFGSGGAAVINSALKNLSPDAHLVGATSSENQTIGKWTKVQYFDKTFDFLPVIHTNDLLNPFLKSQNFQFAISVLKYLGEIKKVSINSIFTQTYTVLWGLAMSPHKWDICYYYPGLGNPMTVGRKPSVGKIAAPIYNIIQGYFVKKTNICFAAASDPAIRDYTSFLKKIGVSKTINPLPTGVDIDLFKQTPKDKARSKLGLPADSKIFIFVGRLAQVKGIDLLLEAFCRISQQHKDSIFLLVGDGEEKNNLVDMAKSFDIENKILFCGMLPPASVALHISASDVCVVGSHTEGFSNAMIEEIACGRPIVSTPVSGADDLIKEGVNGFIVENRDAEEFSEKMLSAMELPMAEKVSREIAVNNYSDSALWKTVIEEWNSVNIVNVHSSLE